MNWNGHDKGIHIVMPSKEGKHRYEIILKLEMLKSQYC